MWRALGTGRAPRPERFDHRADARTFVRRGPHLDDPFTRHPLAQLGIALARDALARPGHAEALVAAALAGSGDDHAVDFVANTDVFRFAAAAFDPLGDIGLGAVTVGMSYSIIAAAYDGTNPGTNTNHGNDLPTFVFSTADSTLYSESV